MSEKSDRSINVSFSKALDYKIVAATGAYGGPTPQGEILCNFFVEYREPPDVLEIQISEEGKSITENPKNDSDYKRELQVGVLLRADIAKLVGEWLVEHANKVLREAEV